MPRSAQFSPSDLNLRFQVGGAQPAQALAVALGVTQSTISRGLARLGDTVVVLGAARRARYALRRPVRSAGDRWPVHRVRADGRAQEWARLESLHGGYRVTWAGAAPAWAELALDREGFTEGMPFFLTDLRQQGFLGRREAQRVAGALGLPTDPRQWGDDDTLVFLQAEGADLPGDLVLGDVPLRRLLAQQIDPDPAGNDAIVSERTRGTRYPELAVRVAAGGLPGSSAGGEQPKFLTTLRRRDGAVQPVLVKFSPPMDTAAGRRWADLLAAEGHALAVLAEHGLATAGARVVDAGGRRFLEVARHDRLGAHGRRGVVSLEALHGAVETGAARTWPEAAEGLARAGWTEPATADAVRRLHAFGELIGNSDMHFGNLSFQLDDTLPLRLAPAYDMLPMAWAPGPHGEVSERAFTPRPPLPAERAAWGDAAAWALDFWQRVVEDDAVSAEFVALARGARTQVERLRERFA